MKRFLSILAVLVMLAMLLPATPVPVQAAGGPQAICVPWQPASPDIPHYSYTGASTTLKGIARGGATQYYWEFGDGSPSTAWTNISNSYNLGVAHTYTGVVGQLFIATLHVRDAANNQAQDQYPVKIYKYTNPAVQSELDVRINMAIDEGLWYLHKNLNRATYGGGAPGYSQPYGYWNDNHFGYTIAATGAAVDAFQMHGSKVNGDYDGDPYVENVQRALNYILYNTQVQSISAEPAGNPDTLANGIGLVCDTSSEQTYAGGICMVALASSGAPNYVSPVGNATWVHGRTLKDIVQDQVDFFAWGQTDPAYGNARGGWRYQWDSSSSDMSTTQWPVLGMTAAEQNMGCTVPAYVRTELAKFIKYTQSVAKDQSNGGFGYDSPSYINNDTKTGAGLICLEFLGPSYFSGDAITYQQRTEMALGYLYRHWNDATMDWGNQQLHGASYGMYAVMKSMRIPEPDITRITEYNYTTMSQTANSLDWYYKPADAAKEEGLAYYNVFSQQADGHWDDPSGSVYYNWLNDAFSTGWRVLILLKGVNLIPPVAQIANSDKLEYDLNQTITLDGSPSHHPDPIRSIISYEWDLDNDGLFDDASGVTATIAGGFTAQGHYPVRLRVTDDNPPALGGAQTDIVVVSIFVHPPCLDPHANAGGPYQGSPTIPITLDGSGSWDSDSPTLFYDWDLDGDGVFDDANGIHPAYTWTIPGKFSIALKVTDNGCNSGVSDFYTGFDIAYTTVEIGNHDPISKPGGPYQAKPGRTITLDGSGSSDPDGDPITFSWDLNNDGTFGDATTVTAPFTLGSFIGTVYNVALKVTDSYVAYKIAYASITVVANQPPTANAGPDQTVEQTSTSGANVTLNGTGSSDPNGDPLTYAWSWTAGSATGPTPTVSLPPGKTTVTLTVTDDDAATGTDTVDITIQDTGKPTVFPPSNVTKEATGPLTVVDILGAFATAFDLADGDVTASLTNNAPASFPVGTTTVTWSAQDSKGNIGTATQQIIVTDTTAPVVTPPINVTVHVATAPAAVAIGSATALDLVDGSLPTTSNAPALFPAGDTTVVWSATDTHGNIGTADQKVSLAVVLHTALTNIGLPAFDPGITDVWVDSLPVPSGSPAGFTPKDAYVVNSAGTGEFTLSFTVADGSNVVVYKINPDPPYNWILLGSPQLTISGNTVTITMSPGDPTFVFGSPSGPIINNAPHSQVWYLYNDTLTDKWTNTELYMSTTGNPTGSVDIAAGTSKMWIANKIAMADVTFPNDAWVIRFGTNADWGAGSNGANFKAEIGYWGKNSSNNVVFTPLPMSYITPVFYAGYYEMQFQSVAIGGQTIPKDTYLAVKVTNAGPVTHPIYTGKWIPDTTGSQYFSCVTSPESDPGYPVPEFSAGILLAAGLLGLGGFFLIKRRKAAAI